MCIYIYIYKPSLDEVYGILLMCVCVCSRRGGCIYIHIYIYISKPSLDEVYGILLMKVFARKKPMDEMFSEDLTLKSWVESLADSMIEVVANLLRREDEEFATKLSCLSSIMVLALACIAESPKERINMKDVVGRLKKIRI